MIDYNIKFKISKKWITMSIFKSNDLIKNIIDSDLLICYADFKKNKLNKYISYYLCVDDESYNARDIINTLIKDEWIVESEDNESVMLSTKALLRTL